MAVCFLARADMAQINQLLLHWQLSQGINRNRNIFVLGGDLCQEATTSAWPCWLWARTHPTQQLPPTVPAAFAGRHRNKLETFLVTFSQFLLHCSSGTSKITAGTWCLMALNGLQNYQEFFKIISKTFWHLQLSVAVNFKIIRCFVLSLSSFLF